MIGAIKESLIAQLAAIQLTFSWVNVVEVLIICAFLFLLYPGMIIIVRSPNVLLDPLLAYNAIFILIDSI